jgi:hypothetical protein
VAKALADNVHLLIQEVSPLGEPLLPIADAKTFVNQCGVVVRNTILITVREWNKPAKADGVSFANDGCTEGLWASLMKHFPLLVLETNALTRAMRLKVKDWDLKKMATQFQTFKTRLYQHYLKGKKLQNSLAH